MAYSEDYRKRAIEYYHEGNTQKEVQDVFKITPPTLRDWIARQEAGCLLPSYPKTRKARKLPLDELKKYVEANPDAFLHEIAAYFGCSDTAVSKRLKKLGITFKKRQSATRKDAKQPEPSIKRQ